jgi:hypothetical protein
MGRKSKPPAKIEFSDCLTEVPQQDGLPPFARHIDIQGESRGQKILTRMFLAKPSDEEIADTMKLKESTQFRLTVIAADMPYFKGTKTNSGLFDHFKVLGLSEAFSTDLVRLLINYLQGKQLSRESVVNAHNSMREFVKFLATRNPSPLKLTDIDKNTWMDFLKAMEASKLSNVEMLFAQARAIFAAYRPTSHRGWLINLPFRKSRLTKPAPEHTSELAESRDYSDVVMYQLLSLFIYEFNRRIEYLKRYEHITEADMPTDWIYPGRRAREVPHTGRLRDTTLLSIQWLQDDEAGYEVLIDHYLLHHKLGLIKRIGSGGLKGGIDAMIRRLRTERGGETELVSKFQAEMGRSHGYDHLRGNLGLLSFYLKKKKPKEANSTINQIGWCLANLIMMQTGVNKEVILTIPSKTEDGGSILDRGDTVFVKKGGIETEIHLFGTKARTGNSPKKVVPVIIVKNSPLHQMLIEYERHVKVDDGPFFEFDDLFIKAWSSGGNTNGNLAGSYPVTDESGQHLSSIDSRRFRKVFASGQLLDRMKNIKDMNELAAMLREDLNHGNLDTTLTHYLMKSAVGRSVIDIAIATITGGKLNDLKCKSQIEVLKPIPFKKKVFLCHCVDPQNPSHEIAIADECKHYDLCLGCEQSIITQIHLPYICRRIIQYEAEREKDPHIWPALYEDKWCIAHDALACYIAKNKKNGRYLVDEAWITARKGLVTLPPIISPNRM